MHLAGLLTAALDDPALARVRDFAAGQAGAGHQGRRSAGGRRPGRHHRVVAAGGRGGGGRGGARRQCRPAVPSLSPPPHGRRRTSRWRWPIWSPRSVAVYPAWETLPHSGSRRAATRWVAGWPSCGGWPIRTRRDRCGWWWRQSGRCCSRSSRAWVTSSPSNCARGDRRPRGRGSTPGRHRVRPHRPRYPPRRVRRPGRHPRRLPADGGTPAAHRVLGRRGRGDPHVCRGRPAHDRPGGAAVGATVPRAAPHRRDPRTGRRAGATTSAARRDAGRSPPASRSRGWSRWRRRCWTARTRSSSSCTACPRAAWCCSATRSGSAPARTIWSGPAMSSCRRAGPPRRPAARRRSTSARPRSSRWPRYG